MEFSSLERQRGLANLRWAKVVLVLLAVIAVFAVGAAQGKKKKAKTLPPPPADLPGHVDYLARQLNGVPLDESGPITSQVQKLVVTHLQGWMATRTPSRVEVRQELEVVFAQLRYPIFARPACFVAPWRAGELIGAGYTLGWTDYDRVNVVALFESQEGKSRLAALTPFVPHTDLHYEILPSRQSDDFRFFIYGFRLGKSQLRLTAILYSFDGHSLKPLWETHDLYDGKIDVAQDRVVLRYLKEEEYVREIPHGRKPPRHEAIYKVTARGLELETDHEIPF